MNKQCYELSQSYITAVEDFHILDNLMRDEQSIRVRDYIFECEDVVEPALKALRKAHIAKINRLEKEIHDLLSKTYKSR